MNRAHGMEERIIPSSCPNISFFPPFFSYLAWTLDVSIRRSGVLSQHMPARIEMWLHVWTSTYVVVCVFPLIPSLLCVHFSVLIHLLFWADLSYLSHFGFQWELMLIKKIRNSLRLSSVILLNPRSGHVAASESMTCLHDWTQTDSEWGRGKTPEVG